MTPLDEQLNRQATPIKLIAQGAPVVNFDTGMIRAHGEHVAAITVDMQSKRCEVFIDHVEGDLPSIVIERGQYGIHFDESKPPDAMTTIAFPDFPGWEVFLSSICKCTLSVVLIHPSWREPREDGQ